MELLFPKFIVCHGCGGRRRVRRREVFEMPSGVAGVAWAKCSKCHHTFVRFIGEKGRTCARFMPERTTFRILEEPSIER